MDVKEKAMQMHEQWAGKIEVIAKAPVGTKEELAIAYTPGVAEPCLAIQKDVDLSYKYTRRHNLVAVVTDGTAVLGLGDIGPEAGMPVMEGKCALFKAFGDVDAFPLCIRSKDVDEIVNTVALLAGSFGGVLAGLTNALKIVGKKMEDIHVVVNGAGAAATAITKLLISRGLKNVILCDRKGAIYEGREGLNPAKEEMAKITNPEKKAGALADVIVGADVFIGVSAPGVLTADMVATMAKDPVVFACANPVPEILPDEAKKAGVKVMATGRSDFPNQVNNVLAFPGIFRGALDVRASDINDEMKIAAANAIAGIVSDSELNPDYILPDAFDARVGKAVAAAVAQAARDTGVARI